MSDDTAPERIWLQTAGSYAEAYEAAIGTDTGVNWCDICTDDDDQEYIRADLGSFYQEKDIDALQACIDALKAERDRLREALEQYAGATDAWGIKYEPIDDKGAVARAALKGDDT